MDPKLPVVISIDLKLHNQEARDLAEFLHRLKWEHIRGCADNDSDAYRMRDVLAKLRVELAEHGYEPHLG